MLLFAEASEGQLDKVLECLTLFCSASGQRVSVEKTKMFFSKGVSHSAVRSLSYKSGFAVTQDLGKYLGGPSSSSTHYQANIWLHYREFASEIGDMEI